MGRNWGAIATEYEASFGGNKNVLKLILKSILFNSVNILKITYLYKLVNYMVCELYLNKAVF